ncbi:putative transcriptional regulatory protein [Colletotrichum trifolii]|uniref:Putative transcriptional regulatory protein n=1 Tax=Colletotrichum trifolii TaxID=5466 RepID=A0A4R8RT58_COLTR|nr:putative transcriptional regulatory protein [Colletotrichum trifolii]
MDSPMDGSGGSSSAPDSTPTATATTPGASVPTAGSTSVGNASTNTPVVSRRSHPKSRTGCRTCKNRKIKCDEHKPSCRNCIKHAVPCDFLQSQRQSSASSIPRSPGGSHTTPGGPSNGTGGGGGGGGGILSFGGLDDLSLNLTDLELMHNFTTFAYTTLSSDPVVRQMWKVPVVRLALECDYVMRALLAVSALHLAHNRPERRDFFISRALTYHQMASRTAMGLMGSLDGENCEKLYLFSVLTIFFALACPRKSSDSLIMGESSFPDWMFLLRGTRGLLQILDPRSYTGPLLPMFTHGRERFRHTRDDSKVQTELLADLQRLVNKNCANPELLPIYNRAIEELRRTLSVFLWDGGRGMDITDAFVWKYLMAEEFLPLLKTPGATQEAVAIFSHFCILLKRLENEWWLQGWATHLISRAWALLDQDHRLWIQWPIEELGWVPP